jgi:hypothetical protein
MKRFTCWHPRSYRGGRRGKKRLDPGRMWKEPSDHKKLGKWSRRTAFRQPGALFMSFLWTAHERMGFGISRTMKEALKTPLTRYISDRAHTVFKTPRDVGEGASLLETLDLMKWGKHREAADLLCCRFKALERSLIKKDWKEAEMLEVRTVIAGSLSETVAR